MNMEEIRKEVANLFKKCGKDSILGNSIYLKTIDIYEESEGLWDFVEYYNIQNKHHDDHTTANGEERLFLIRHAQFLVAYRDWRINNPPRGDPVDFTMEEMKRRNEHFKDLERLIAEGQT